ncbi:MAG TPA: copper chaperone PCu(A)C [Caulobacteraceae bacterium]|jgi:copper(I)-binding protein|nr:copper chaperone PCu(A)C [Caulobacteraceae bacterium]
MIRALASTAILAALPAVASAAIVIERPEIRASLGAQPTTAAYLTIRNTGAAPDRLLGASCACAAMVMAHRSTTANGISRMSMEAVVEVPAHGSVAFTPTGRHLMLTGVKAPIAPGAKVPIVLRFEKAGPVTAVFAASATPGMGAEHQHH